MKSVSESRSPEEIVSARQKIIAGIDSYLSHFKRVIKYELLASFIQKKMKLQITIPKRHHSSGAICAAIASPIQPLTLEQGMLIAAKFIDMTSAKGKWGSELTQARLASLEGTINWKTTYVESFLPVLPGNERKATPSLKNMGASNKGGLSNLSKYSLHKQTDNFAKRSGHKKD